MALGTWADYPAFRAEPNSLFFIETNDTNMQLVVKSSSSSIITPLDGTITISTYQNMELIFLSRNVYDGIIPIHTNGYIDYSRTFRIFIVEKNFDVFVV